jgi:hypothetical protein
MRRLALLLSAGLAVTAASVSWADKPEKDCQPQPWRQVGATSFVGGDSLLRSQGVTSDGHGWMFSWQGGPSRTDDNYLDQAIGTLPPDIAVDNPTFDPATRENHIGGNHIGDIDVDGDTLLAPVEDGGQGELNNPEYQRGFIALYDPATMTYTGKKYLLPLALQAAGVPWVAVDHGNHDVYSAEWEMPHDRLNVYAFDAGRAHLSFQRFVDLHYPAALGAGFHLSRIQGAKILGDTMYVSRDDATKSVFSIDLPTGVVTPLFSINPGVPAELEGIAVRQTADGALLHVLIVKNNKVDQSQTSQQIHTELLHYAPAVVCDDGPGKHKHDD